MGFESSLDLASGHCGQSLRDNRFSIFLSQLHNKKNGLSFVESFLILDIQSLSPFTAYSWLKRWFYKYAKLCFLWLFLTQWLFLKWPPGRQFVWVVTNWQLCLINDRYIELHWKKLHSTYVTRKILFLYCWTYKIKFFLKIYYFDMPFFGIKSVYKQIKLPKIWYGT